MHIVRKIKEYSHIQVANAMYAMGYVWRRPNQRPTNIEKMVQGLPKHELQKLLATLKS